MRYKEYIALAIAIFALWCVCPEGVVHAAEEGETNIASTTTEAASGPMRQLNAPAINVWRSVLSLLLVLGLLFGVSWVLKKKSLNRIGLGGAKRRIQVLERYSFDNKRGLLLVRCGDEELLLGMTHDRITTLNKHDVSDLDADLESLEGSA